MYNLSFKNLAKVTTINKICNKNLLILSFSRLWTNIFVCLDKKV
mgnify:CR=1 FL=1